MLSKGVSQQFRPSVVSVMLSVNADTCAGCQCSVQHRSAVSVMYPHSSLWALEWEGSPRLQSFVTPAEAVYMERLSGVMLPSSI